MLDSHTSLDKALAELTSEFPDVRPRIVAQMFLGYLERADTLTAAVGATRARIIDACASGESAVANTGNPLF